MAQSWKRKYHSVPIEWLLIMKNLLTASGIFLEKFKTMAAYYENRRLMMSRRYRSKSLLPTELTWEERNQPNYLFQPSKAFTRMEKMDIRWFNSTSKSCAGARMAPFRNAKNLKNQRK